MGLISDLYPEKKEKIMSIENERDPGTERFIDSLPEKQKTIYRKMRRDYDILTNKGENYDAEKHDEEVAELATKEFTISKEQANKLYVATEMEIADFHSNRLHNTPATFEQWLVIKGYSVLTRYDENQNLYLISIDGSDEIPYNKLPESPFKELFRAWILRRIK
jgi:hypothetical protein